MIEISFHEGIKSLLPLQMIEKIKGYLEEHVSVKIEKGNHIPFCFEVNSGKFYASII